ncbi:MAG TPA: hypothetical protein VGH74_22780, partial [Planctomycetaceae bacterium]
LITVGQQSLTPVLGTLATTAWTNGSATVIGTGTTYITSLKTGEFILGPDGKFYTIQTINSNTSLTLTSGFTGVTQASFIANFYNTLVTWANGSPAVTGAGTGLNFLLTLAPGQVLQGPDGNFYAIATINSPTSLTLTTPFAGTSGASASASALPSGAFHTVGFIGDGTVGGVAASTSTSAFNLYQFQTLSSTESVTILASNIAAGLGGAVQITLFDSLGAVQGNSVSGILTVSNLKANSTYIVGVSGTGNTYNPITGVSTAPGAGVGSYNLSIHVTNPIPQALDTTSFATSTNLGTLGVAGASINNTIQALTNIIYPALPGGTSYPGNRNIPLGGETDAAEPSSTQPAPIPVFYYNFQDNYGVDPQGNALHNAITENQKADARQIFDMYGQYLGVKFIETDFTGLTVVTGDIRAVDPSIDPTAAGGIEGGGEVVINAAFDYGSSPYGGSWFGTAFHEIGHALGLVHIGDAPGTMNASADDPNAVNPFPPAEPVFPGDTALVSAERINPPDSV